MAGMTETIAQRLCEHRSPNATWHLCPRCYGVTLTTEQVHERMAARWLRVLPVSEASA